VAAYVANGGWCVVSTRTGIKNLHNVAYAETAPALLRELLGLEIEDSDVLGERKCRVRLESGGEFEARTWCDVLSLKGAQALARYTTDFYSGAPAVTAHKHGTGKAYYLGAVMAEDFYRAFLARLADERGLGVLQKLPAGVEAVARRKEAAEFLFVANTTAESCKFALDRRGRNLLDDSRVDGSLSLEAYGVAVVKVEP
jgi:beta-galactosidase